MPCKDFKHPLKRGGTNQKQRQLDALREDYVRIDENEFKDWIVFAAKFSEYIKYFNPLNSTRPAGSWKPFFENDISAVFGTIAIQDIDQYRYEIKSRFDLLKSDEHKTETNLLKETFADIFNALLTFSQSLDNLIIRLPDEPSLKLTISNLLEGKLRYSLNHLLAYYKAAAAYNLLSEKDRLDWKIFNNTVHKTSTIISEGLNNAWIITSDTDWTDYYNNIVSDPTIYGDSSGDTFRKINHAVNHNLFAGIFDQYLMAFSKIVKSAEDALIITLSNWDTHQPHYALFLSFLRLFKLAQNSINTVTKRHLDFYYREVLSLKPAEPQANHAHIILELAKQADDYLLKKGTQFKAGKDSMGKEVLYSLDKDTVFNKAKINRLMALYKGSSKDNIDTAINDKRLFAAPVVNSADGLGEKLASSQGEWHPFVNKTYLEGELESINMPNAEIGFAVASHYLYLTEGERKVFLKLATNNNSALTNLSADCYLTTEKEWYKIETIQTDIGTMSDAASCITISFTLSGTVPPIINYNAEVHDGVFDCELPILKVHLKQDDLQAYQYDDLKDITITKIELEVKVGDSSGYTETGLKQLLLLSDSGPVDSSKPFQPFGPIPRKSAALIIGNKEIFSKENAKINLNVNWANLPSSPSDIDYDDPYTWEYYPSVSFSFLYGGKWNEAENNINIFNLTDAEVNFPSSFWEPVPSESIVDYLDDYNPYDINSSKGFFRFTLNGDFGHKGYQDALVAYLIAQSKTPATGTKPIEPYTPVMQSLYLSYSASTLEDITTEEKTLFDNRAVRFFHIYPFGEVEQHSYISGDSTLYLVPQFKYETYNEETELYERYSNIGEFYLGFEDLKPGQSLSLLFQILEGSSDPLIQKPDKHVFWSYLSNDKWISFNSTSVSDQTNQLIQSGLIEFALPEDASADNLVLPKGYIWLRASISELPDAVCKILGLFTQAAEVTFQSNDNACDLLNYSLPANSISKLKEPLSAVKKIEQPYSSFGGRPKETDDHFYIRVSERLRHKNRAVTIWDYERMILEAFPQIHKVKCLSHTKLVPDANDPEVKIYSELAPGYVTVITVPDLKNRNDTDPLKPYTNTDLLVEIKNFLKSKSTCHAKIITENPLFEELRLEFTLKLLKGFNDRVFYKKQLQEEITQFLTPWAFDSSADIQFGGKVYKSVLIDFIEERPYVDFITDVKLYHTVDGIESGDLEEVSGSSQRSILVSVPASHHEIYVLPDEEEIISEDQCEYYEPVVNNN